MQYKKKSNKFYRGQVGTASVLNGNFKAAERRIPMFTSRIDKDVVDSEITDYILQKTQELVKLEKIKIRNEKFYKAFKFFVAEFETSSIYLGGNGDRWTRIDTRSRRARRCNKYSSMLIAGYNGVLK